MTYTAYETATQTGAPVMLLYFAKGAVVWRYNTGPVDITVLGESWTSAPITPSKLSLTNDVVKDALELQFPMDNSFAAQFLAPNPDDEATVIIYRLHVVDEDEDAQVVWQGTASSAFLADKGITVTCEHISKRMARSSLMATYQGQCRHAVYSARCGLDRADFDYSATVDSVSGSLVTLQAGHGITDGALTGGEIQKGAYRRFIVLHSGDDLTLIRPLSGLAASDSVTLIEGCDRTMATCITKNNVENYGGFPWIPTINPFKNGL